MSKLSARTAPRSGDTPLEARILAVLAIVLATTLAAGLTGLIAAGENDEWYRGLNKAPGTPPEVVSTVVWPMLYSLMTIGAIIVWNAAGSWRLADGAIGVYFVQLAAKLGWSALFFLLHTPIAALIALGVLWVLIVLLMLEFRRHSLVAALLQTPYLLWASFSIYLNLWVVLANQSGSGRCQRLDAFEQDLPAQREIGFDPLILNRAQDRTDPRPLLYACCNHVVAADRKRWALPAVKDGQALLPVCVLLRVCGAAQHHTIAQHRLANAIRQPLQGLGGDIGRDCFCGSCRREEPRPFVVGDLHAARQSQERCFIAWRQRKYAQERVCISAIRVLGGDQMRQSFNIATFEPNRREDASILHGVQRGRWRGGRDEFLELVPYPFS